MRKQHSVFPHDEHPCAFPGGHFKCVLELVRTLHFQRLKLAAELPAREFRLSEYACGGWIVQKSER